MTERVEEYGRTWDRRTPRGSVDHMLGNRHAGTPFAEIERELRELMAKNPKFTPELVAETIEYARIVHQENADLYRAVITGRI